MLCNLILISFSDLCWVKMKVFKLLSKVRLENTDERQTLSVHSDLTSMFFFLWMCSSDCLTFLFFICSGFHFFISLIFVWMVLNSFIYFYWTHRNTSKHLSRRHREKQCVSALLFVGSIWLSETLYLENKWYKI